MGREGDSPKDNIFVRFKHRVDDNVATGINTIFGSEQAPTSASSSSEAEARSSTNLSEPDDGLQLPASSPHSSHQSSGTMEQSPEFNAQRELAPLSLLSISSYSPIALRHLPRPVPNDREPHMRSSVFTFEDAFEDLLAVSQGQELPPIQTRYELRKSLNAMYPRGEPSYAWLSRLQSQGLLQLPRPDPFFTFPSFSPRESERNADGFFFRELDSVMRQLGLAPSSDEDDDTSKPRNTTLQQQKQRNEEEGTLPDNEQDFFASTKSQWDEEPRTWDNFIKSLREDHSAAHDQSDSNKGAQKSAPKENQVVDKKEYVDSFGYVHSTVKTKILDEQGNEIGTSVHHSVRHRDEDSAKPRSIKANTEEEQEEGAQAPRKIGWFWKRDK